MQINSSIANGAQGVGDVADRAKRGALGANGAVGDHIGRTSSCAEGSVEIVIG